MNTLWIWRKLMEKENLKVKAYEYIREQIMNCVYQPGELLSESKIVEALGVSRTPVREALNRLEQENLIRIVPKQGIWVSDISFGMIMSIYETRILVEPEAIRKYGNQVPVDELEKLIKIVETMRGMDEKQAVDADIGIHRLIMHAMPNEFIHGMMEKVYMQNHRIGILTGRLENKRITESVNEHRIILEKILTGEYEEAAEAMVHHLINSRQASLDTIMQGSANLLKLSI